MRLFLALFFCLFTIVTAHAQIKNEKKSFFEIKAGISGCKWIPAETNSWLHGEEFYYEPGFLTSFSAHFRLGGARLFLVPEVGYSSYRTRTDFKNASLTHNYLQSSVSLKYFITGSKFSPYISLGPYLSKELSKSIDSDYDVIKEEIVFRLEGDPFGLIANVGTLWHVTDKTHLIFELRYDKTFYNQQRSIDVIKLNANTFAFVAGVGF
jgi:hypothetical protein